MSAEFTKIHEAQCELAIEGETLSLVGYIKLNCFKDLIALVDGKKISLVVVKSTGGNPRAAVDIGLWVHKMGIDVEVDTLCGSSCANYIFPAGKDKYIRRNSIVGWHGGVDKKGGVCYYLAKNTNLFTFKECRETSILTKNTKCVAKRSESFCLEDYKRKERHLAEDIEDLYNSLGVNHDIVNFGIAREEHINKEDPNTVLRNNFKVGKVSFWTYSLEDMEKFGISNIHQTGDNTSVNRLSIMLYDFLQVRTIEPEFL